MTKRILIMAGGTGGHVFPALAVAQEMLARNWRVSWLGTKKGLESRVVPDNGIDIDWLVVEGVRGKGLWSKLKAVIKLLQACYQAFFILIQRKPHIVLGMGGFVSVPGGLMAKLLGIPVVIHEQNRVPGSANRLLVKLAANKVLEAFPNSFNKSVNAICTGNPLRKEFVFAVKKSGLLMDELRPFRILVLGGSQGAKVLNDTVPDGLVQLNNITVLHQTGTAMKDIVEQRYLQLGITAEVLAFIDDMSTAYQWADLIICRAGAMTVSEVAASGLPAIFVPLLTAIDDHQTANACYLVESSAALLLPQTELNPENLSLTIKQAMASLTLMGQAAFTQAKLNATQVVADICVAEARS